MLPFQGSGSASVAPNSKGTGAPQGRSTMTMLNILGRAERCRDLAEECRRVDAMYPSTEMANHYRRMAEHYSSLAEADELCSVADGH
jgi:hypothetical protein